ncbi:lysine exporter protein LysE/YggA [Nitratireductor aquibiodomus RA22]|uniref:Lysine exporter protein LysE/YggA n=1 Tax=Nitratireductor aquibiodomus RA22 TaxID=1189611 RepID=I5BSU8_9HYPH|nr:LysE family translocator [Nitratireductor aquibiodomus]EIM72650.1 lysine exporter protein LysE/YggA [Nitratireductor aquibiodomus RA22]
MSSTMLIFVITSIALAFTPGPDMLLCLSRSIRSGRMAGIASAIGSTLGLYLQAVVAAMGLSGLLAVLPEVYIVVKYLGAAYLLYLAWRMIRSDAFLGRDMAMPEKSYMWIFVQGVLTNLTNPKAIVFFISFFPQFIDPERSILLQSLALGTIINVFSLSVLVLICLAAATWKNWIMTRPTMIRLQNWLVASMFGLFAVRILTTPSRG